MKRACPGTGFAPCDRPANASGYCADCQEFLDRTYLGNIAHREISRLQREVGQRRNALNRLRAVLKGGAE